MLGSGWQMLGMSAVIGDISKHGIRYRSTISLNFRFIQIIIVSENFHKFSINPACIRKSPLNPPLQKGEAVGMPLLIEMLQISSENIKYCQVIYFPYMNSTQNILAPLVG
jgi:hypothetical protein